MSLFFQSQHLGFDSAGEFRVERSIGLKGSPPGSGFGVPFFFGFHRGFRGNPDEDPGSQRAGRFDPMTAGEEFPDAADGRQFSWWNLLHQSIHLERTWNDQVSFPLFVPDFFRDGGNPRKILDVLEFLLPASFCYFHPVPFQSICICFDPDSHALQVFNGS